MTDKTAKARAEEQIAVQDELQEKAKDRAEEAQTELPDGTTCELCNRPIEKGDKWVVNISGNYAHKDADCPAGDDSELPVEGHYDGNSNLIDKDGNVIETTGNAGLSKETRQQRLHSRVGDAADRSSEKQVGDAAKR